MNVTSTDKISMLRVLDRSDLKIRITIHVTYIQNALGLNANPEPPYRQYGQLGHVAA
jgi:hypothetical protein